LSGGGAKLFAVNKRTLRNFTRGFRLGRIPGSCERGNELSDPEIGEEILD